MTFKTSLSLLVMNTIVC